MDFSKLKATLEKHRFTVSAFGSAAEAAEYLAAGIKGETVGFGGSVTVEEMGLYDKLGKDNTVIWHWKDPKNRFRSAEFTAYVTSVNAIAETGELINIDGSGNRLAASLFGPKKVYFVVGRNKIAPDLPQAIERARQVACPPNNQRLDLPNPCTKTGKCHDCNSPSRICNALVIHMRPMLTTEHTEVVLIDEDLGF